MEKQIEEINEIIASKICESYSPICDEWQPHDCGKCYANDTHISEISETIYNEGYRKQEWISVEERLPEKNYHDFVLAWNGLHVEFLHYSHRYKQWEDYYSLKEHPWKVTHWMPLPEAPKGDAE